MRYFKVPLGMNLPLFNVQLKLKLNGVSTDRVERRILSENWIQIDEKRRSKRGDCMHR